MLLKSGFPYNVLCQSLELFIMLQRDGFSNSGSKFHYSLENAIWKKSNVKILDQACATLRSLWLVALCMPQVGFCMFHVGCFVRGGCTMHATGQI